MAIIVAPLSRDLTKFPVGTTGARLDEASLRFKRYQLSLDLNCLYEESEIWPADFIRVSVLSTFFRNAPGI